MTVANTPAILVTVTSEPPAYHGIEVNTRTRVYAVHLALSGNKTEVTNLLGMGPWSFTAYQLDGNRADVATTVISSQSLITAREGRLTEWLAGRSTFGAPTTAVPGTVELDDTSSATPQFPNVRDVLHGSIAWDAPMPQDLGLTCLVQCTIQDGAVWPAQFLILPTTSESVATPVNDSDTVTVTLPGPNPVELVTGIVGDSKPLLSPVSDDGFLKATFSSDDHRLLEALESKGASLIWMLPAFTGFLSAKALQTEAGGTPIDPGAMQTYRQIGCCLAFDPLLLAIGANGSDRVGVLLGGLAAEIDNAQLSINERMRLVDTGINGVRNQATAMMGNASADEWKARLLAFRVPPNVVNSLFDLGTLSALIDGLNALMVHFQKGAGIEKVLHAIIEKFLSTPSATDAAIVAACRAYLAHLDSGINVSDAIRAEIGHQVLTQVLTQVLKSGQTPADVLKASNVFLPRLTSPLGPCLFLASADISAEMSDELETYLEARWAFAVEDFTLAPNAPVRKRFHADSVPQPLPISISTTADSHNLDEFTQRFNGIGVVIRSGDSAADVWCHANLAEFHPWRSDPSRVEYDPASSRVGIRALLPVAVDGRRQMFLRYHGFPLSSEAYCDTGIENEGPARRQAFYGSNDLANYQDHGFARVPRLAYGNTYEWVAYAVTKGGSLPLMLQKESLGEAAPTPWLPKADLGTFVPPAKDVVGSEVYRRRTAVGATTIADSPDQPPRIGVRFPEVFPLSLDSPRLCLSANTGHHEIRPFIDLFRNADGSGQLTTTTEDMWQLRLDGLLLTTSESNATVNVVAELRGYDTKEDQKGDQVFSSQKGSPLNAELEITLPPPAAPPASPAGAEPSPETPPTSHNLWLRLRLEVEKSGTASLAFNPPIMTRSQGGNAGQARDSDQFPCHADTPPVLLVGSSQCWSSTFKQPAMAQVVLPRTTWLDWEHWCGNESLSMYGRERTNNDVFSKADKHLLTASVLRSLDDDINRLLDRLPDPSVSAMIAELTVTDRLIDSAPGASQPAPKSVVIDCSKICGDAFHSEPQPDVARDAYGVALREWLAVLDRQCRIAVTFAASKSGEAKLVFDARTGVVVQIPEGMTARLTIRPFVPWPERGDHSAFHAGIAELAVGEATVTLGDTRTPGYLFEGASLTIEAMYDLPRDADRDRPRDSKQRFLDHIKIATIPHVRDYRVMFEPKLVELQKTGVAGNVDAAAAPSENPPVVPACRLFSHVEMRTQRWRFSGRPIYRWIKPKDFRRQPNDRQASDASSPASPAIELVESDQSDAIKEFEAEIFFDRDDADCEFTRVRLTGGRDELLSCPWELPSATYFRHAFNFVSRYAGAMQPGQGRPLWPSRPADWSHRVAILADAPRLEVTRPQMRCIVPLTTSPDDAAPCAAAPDIEQRRLAPTAPVACILEERPFAVGGLAERMLGEIVTGVGYGFDGVDSRVHPRDFGKETSRDGRLSAWGWSPPTGFTDQPNPARSFIVETEGPIGLHFEEVTTPAPAWSNCQYLLRPRSLRDRQPLPEESFLAVQLRRFLDPDWIFDAKPAARAQANASATATPSPPPDDWPLSLPCIARHSLATLANACGTLASVTLDGSGSMSLIDFEVRESDQTSPGSIVAFARRTVLGANYPEGSLPLCEIPLPASGVAGEAGELALLHIPHGDGSSTISIALVPADDGAADGRANVPLIVGTARWTLAHLLATKPSDDAAEPSPQAKAAAIQFPAVNGASPDVRATSMSQPTYREWTRTSKNADFVTAMTNDGQDRPIRVGGIRARVIPRNPKDQKSTAKMLEFRLPAGNNTDIPEIERTALWLCGSLANSRMPLFVHRYLVGVFSSASSSGGRTYRSFSHASLLGDRRPWLPAAADGDIESLTLHEMEVPAQIVAAGQVLPKNLARFKTATIDLKATGGLPADDQTIAYRLHVRFANSKASMETTTATVTVATPDRTITVNVPQGIQSLDVMWTLGPKASANNAPGTKVFSRLILWDCLKKTPPPPITTLSDPLKPNAATVITVTLENVSGPTELWADVSLLHRPVEKNSQVGPEDFNAFTFDWLFSSRDTGDDRSPASRTLSSTLATRVEAQGRFVSSSQPIVIDPS